MEKAAVVVPATPLGSGNAAGERLLVPEPNQLLDSVIEFLPDATFVIDRDRRIVAWNRACEVMTGVMKESLLGKGDHAYSEPFYGDRSPMLVDMLDMPSPEPTPRYRSVERKGDALCAESFSPRLRSGRGAQLWGEAAHLFDRQGGLCGAITVVRDITEQRRVEMALKDSRERLLKAQRVARVGFLDWDLKTNEIFLSDETCELVGFRPEGQVTTPDFLTRSVHPDDLAYAAENLNLAIQGQKPYDIVHRHVRPDGSILWVHSQAELSRDDKGVPTRLLGTMVDITEQKRVEGALRESELKYRALFETANDAILLMRQDRVIDCNARTLVVFGCSRDQIVGASLLQYSPPVQPNGRRSDEEVVRRIDLSLTAGPQSFEWQHRREDGHPFSVEVSLSRLELGGQVLLQAIVRDVTARKLTETALIQREREYHELVMLANSIILRWTQDGRITFLNEFGQRFFGFTEEEIVGRHVLGTIVPLQETSGRNLRSVMEEVCADPHRFERSVNENVRRNGERVWIDWTNRVVHDDEGGIREILSIGSDITDRKQAEEQVRSLNADLRRHAGDLEQRVLARTEQLAARNQELKDFAYTVSHDLKAPLRGIAGYASELVRKHSSGLGNRAHFCLAQIQTATTHLDQLIEDLLRYSRLESQEPTYAAVDVRVMVDQILRDRDLVIKEQHVEVTLVVSPVAFPTWERGLAQVLSNLIDNAIKYSRQARPPRLRISAADTGTGWRLAVSDNGIGFDLKYHDRLFKLFNRLVRVEDFEGTGAGLAIARRVVEKLKGRIWAESAPGQGATFFVELPKATT